MSQIILVDSYFGSSFSTYRVEVTGRKLGLDEVRSLGLVDDDALRRHAASDYSHEWYEINYRDRITVTVGERELGLAVLAEYAVRVLYEVGNREGLGPETQLREQAVVVVVVHPGPSDDQQR